MYSYKNDGATKKSPNASKSANAFFARHFRKEITIANAYEKIGKALADAKKEKNAGEWKETKLTMPDGYATFKRQDREPRDDVLFTLFDNNGKRRMEMNEWWGGHIYEAISDWGKIVTTIKDKSVGLVQACKEMNNFARLVKKIETLDRARINYPAVVEIFRKSLDDAMNTADGMKNELREKGMLLHEQETKIDSVIAAASKLKKTLRNDLKNITEEVKKMKMNLNGIKIEKSGT